MKRAGSARARGRAAMILDVQRRIAMALLSVPLAGAGWLTAHSVAYELAEPDSHDRAKVLSATGHGYLEFEPLFIACGFVLMVAGLFASVTEGIRDRPHARPPSRLFALTPVLALAQPSPDAARPLPLALVPGSGPRALPAARGV